MIRLRGARLVTPEGVRDGQAVTLADGRIVEIAADHAASAADVECAGGWLVPGFVDTHVHGVGGVDVLAGGEAVARVASLLPRYGVTAFLPTSVACPPDVLATFVRAAPQRMSRHVGVPSFALATTGAMRSGKTSKKSSSPSLITASPPTCTQAQPSAVRFKRYSLHMP